MGFEFHHTKKDSLTLCKWLGGGTSKLPEYATHTVGVGAFVIDKTSNKVLVVKEKVGPAKGIWKMPTGSVETDEEIKDGAIREVFEETGIQSEFEQLLCFRQSPHIFQRSNLFFVVLLRPTSFDIKIQEDEIEKAKWMDVCTPFTSFRLKCTGR